MDPVRLGQAFRAMRIRRRWRQADLASAAGVSRQLVSKVETGNLASVSVRTLEVIAARLGASLDIGVRWRGEGPDRLLDAAHAALVERVVARLQSLGWETLVEVSFAVRGERGSVDVFALIDRPPACSSSRSSLSYRIARR